MAVFPLRLHSSGALPRLAYKVRLPASFGQEAFQNRHPGIIAVADPDLARDRRTKETKNDGRADHDERLGDPLSHPRVHAAARAPCAATTTKAAVAATDGDAAKHLGEARRAGDRAMKRSIVAALLAMLTGVPWIPVSMADTSITDLFPKPGTKIEPFQPGTPWSTYAFAAQRCLLQGTPADVAYMLRRTFTDKLTRDDQMFTDKLTRDDQKELLLHCSDTLCPAILRGTVRNRDGDTKAKS